MNTRLEQSPVYKKAVSVYMLSRKLTTYLTDDKDFNLLYKSTHKGEQELELMVVDSFSLAPNVALAEVSEEKIKRKKQVLQLLQATKRIQKRIVRVQSLYRKDQDYLNLFNNELCGFDRLLRKRIPSLLAKN